MLRPFVFAFAAALVAPSPVLAGCTDQARPGVDWRRCLKDGESLPGIDLSGGVLRDAGFLRADLTKANLSRADAFRARFVSATLAGANLDRATFGQADFTKADLRGASLAGADLRDARMFEADLREAVLTGARIDRLDLSRADLTGATWIDGDKVCAEGSIGVCR